MHVHLVHASLELLDNFTTVVHHQPEQQFYIIVGIHHGLSFCLVTFIYHSGYPPKNAPTLRCHIFKNIEFDVFKFSTVI